MKIRPALLLAVIFSVILTVPSSASANRFAVVIGNSKYPDADAPLKEPINDAHDIADELKRDGFDVDIGENLTGEAMRRAFDRLYTKIKPGDVVLLFFSGYGIQSNRQSYMIPVDARIWKEIDVRRDGLSIESVLGAMKERGAKVKLAVIDASRRNPYERRFRSFSHGLAPINVPDHALILSSATPGQVVEESGGQYSLLMAELLKNMDTPNAGAEAVFNKTRLSVSRASEGEQIPAVSSSLAEDVPLKSDTAVASRKAGS